MMSKAHVQANMLLSCNDCFSSIPQQVRADPIGAITDQFPHSCPMHSCSLRISTAEARARHILRGWPPWCTPRLRPVQTPPSVHVLLVNAKARACAALESKMILRAGI